MKNIDMKELSLVILRGVGQIMFQRNALSGALMLIGLAIGSWWLMLLTLAGSIAGTLFAKILGCSEKGISDGLFGYNSALSGLAVGVFFSPSVYSVALFLGVTIISIYFTVILGKLKRLPVLTAPFVIATWLMLLAGKIIFPEQFLPSVEIEMQVEANWVRAFCLNIGQVMFEGNAILTGVFFILGILVNSRVNAFYAVFGSVLPLLLGFVLTDLSAFNSGLVGYNAILSAIALGTKSWNGVISAVLAVAMSVAFQLFGMEYGVITLTAPFVVSVWLVSLVRRPSF